MVLDSDPWFAAARTSARRGDPSGGRNFGAAGHSHGRDGVLSAHRAQRVRSGVVAAKAHATASDQGNSRPRLISPVVGHGSGALR